MRTVARFLLIALAIIGVGSLGYYAYILGVQTLSYPFLGSDTQKGTRLDVVVAEPISIMHLGSGPLLDEGALRASLYFGTTSTDTHGIVSGEYTLSVSGSRISVSVPTIQIGQVLTLDARSYNDKKSTQYRLPHDLTLTSLDAPRSLSIAPIGLPREAKYHVSMYGFPDYTPEHIRYFVSYDTGIDCSLSTPWEHYAPIFPRAIRPLTRDGQVLEMDVSFSLDAMQPSLCLVGGVNGVYQVIADRHLDPFTGSISTIETLSPEYDMQSRIELEFSHPIYEDTGAIYSAEYRVNRHDAKLAFLKHLSLSPDMALTPENIILTPDHVIVTLPLIEGAKSEISLDGQTDIYGRTLSMQYSLIPEQSPFLSLRFPDDRHYYHMSEPIPTKLYALGAPKKSYTLKLCELSLEDYAHAERMLSEEMTGGALDTIYTLLAGGHGYRCSKKDIDLTATGYISNFDARSLAPGSGFSPGMYILTFMNPDDIKGFQRPVRPLIFTVMDSHITMKVDASGKMFFLVTDALTGNPLPDQEITLRRNITRTYSETWNPQTNQSDRTYLPFTTQAFATGVLLGRTKSDGFLEVKLEGLAGLESTESPYTLAFEHRGEYEGRYASFIAESRGIGHFGSLVSTWNDAITGSNFGMKESDYSPESRPKYTAYLHTDRRLYLPGDIVHIHTIIRENNTTLRVPGDISYSLIITDPIGKEVSRTALKPNEFGTISTDLTLAKDTPLGNYSLSLMTLDQTEYVAYGVSNFQVEVFTHPTFTATVELRSPDIEGESVKNLRKKPNTDPNTPWYTDLYEGKLVLNGIVKAKYSDAIAMKNTPFMYRISRREYYGEKYSRDCSRDCPSEEHLEYYTEGSGMIDQDGLGVFSVPVEYSSSYSDYQYTAEVVIHDPLSREEVTTPSSLIVKLPDAYKPFSPDNAITFTAKKKILQNGESIVGTFQRKYGSGDPCLVGKYSYEIIRREYQEQYVEDIASGSINISTPIEHVMSSGAVIAGAFTQKLIAYPPGEYIIRTAAKALSGSIVPDGARSETLFYIAGGLSGAQGRAIRVIPEKTMYQPGEMARVLITVPFTGSHILLTLEKGGVIAREYFTLTGNTFTREYKVDDTLLPNAYIGVVALAPMNSGSTRSYAVGYGEIVADVTQKQAILTLTPDKLAYKNRESVTLDMTLSDRSGNPFQGEVAVMVVDESLIHLLGNIDLDILPKFYQKYPFTMKTALSAIGIDHNRWLSRKGSNSGSGDEGSGSGSGDTGGIGVEITSKHLFQNTAYYNPSIRTDAQGKAKITFSLPDTTTDSRIIAIGNTKDAHFAIAEKTIPVRKDYMLESLSPTILRPGDNSHITVGVSNSTRKITGTTLTLYIGTGASVITQSLDLTLSPSESLSRDFTFSVLPGWSGMVPYRVELREKNILLESITKSFRLVPIPLIEATSRAVRVWSGTELTYTLPLLGSGMDQRSSLVQVTLSTSSVSELSNEIRSLVQYPYGGIEQTIASTLSNALALAFADRIDLSIDQSTASENIRVALAKILRMQHYSGGWTYGEGDTDVERHITPYVLRSLIAFRHLGQTIPDSVLENGAKYITTNLSSYLQDPDSLAEAVWTLALLKHTPEALEAWKSIDVKSLTRHGSLAYAAAAEILAVTPSDMVVDLDRVMFSTGGRDDSWYWDRSADQAIYAGLLIDRGDTLKGYALIDRIVRGTDLTSSRVSTQTKIQIFRAILKQIEKSGKLLQKSLPMAFRSDTLIVDASLTPVKTTRTIESTREKIGGSFTLKRDDARLPVYITVTTRDRTKSIIDMPPENALGMNIVRTFELVDESKGVDTAQRFLSLTPVTDGIFHRGSLYRATVKVFLPPTTQSDPWYHLSIEDAYPGGWRPINSNPYTEHMLTHSIVNEGQGYTESRDDRIFSSIDTGYTSTHTATYYFRPSILGTYLLPPASASYMYRPEVHAATRYEKIQVKE